MPPAGWFQKHDFESAKGQGRLPGSGNPASSEQATVTHADLTPGRGAERQARKPVRRREAELEPAISHAARSTPRHLLETGSKPSATRSDEVSDLPVFWLVTSALV